ncbi:hypothetical protein SCOCK_980002 [Actinacidiphila cocklensis]|uniref:Uncharacterized protein n=1 Tax=Actinacidiphila cocklensis TaxID=887465 RepID=A0A9W4GVP7_9ACTN|nr:hypothetical protein SCOCK_980002 [Actinacidiphila cocklensis]
MFRLRRRRDGAQRISDARNHNVGTDAISTTLRGQLAIHIYREAGSVLSPRRGGLLDVRHTALRMIPEWRRAGETRGHPVAQVPSSTCCLTKC